MDLLRYSETVLHLCLANKPKREIYDILRQCYGTPHRIRICPCIKDPWVRKTLEFLGAVYDNEASCERSGHESDRTFTAGAPEPVGSRDEHGV